MSEYWNEIVTVKSWEKLLEIAKEFDVTVIGGWAVYLWTKQHKSKDIDVVVDYTSLEKLRATFNLAKNDRLNKYEVKFEQFDMDIYVPHYSKLELPVEILLENTVVINGVKTISAENLLILKQGAERDRKNTIKGKKDAIDIISLLLYAVDLEEYFKTLKKHSKLHLLIELTRVIREFDNKDSHYVGKTFKQISQWKKETLEKIRNVK
ncbi:MAG: hypothetical protein V1722_00155 [Candidatus Micrarchaeota archaeon]